MSLAYIERKLSYNERRALAKKGFTNEDLEGISIATITPYGKKRLDEAMEKITQALINDYNESQSKKSSLPSDWRTRLIRS
jgi:hypothetical protein